MSFRPISPRRLHVLYTTPLVLSLACILFVLSALCGLVPWRQTSQTVMFVHRESSNSSESRQGNYSATFYFGLLGSCYREAHGERLQCTSAAFPPDYDSIIARGGASINAEHLQIEMPDLPPVFLVWIFVSVVALVCQALGALPFYAPKIFFKQRFISEKFFSAALWILGGGWAFGFSAVLGLACFVASFGAEYNLSSSDFYYNRASAGKIFVLLTIALVVQIIVGIAIIVQIATAPTAEKEAFSNSAWSTSLKVTGP